GYSHFYLKSYEMAIQYWERLLANFPHLSETNEILYWLAEASLSKQDYRKGVGYVDKLRGDPNLYPKGLNSLGWYHFQRREWQEANQYFLKILTEFPQYQTTPSLFLLVGECYLNQNDYEKAKGYLTRSTSAAEQTGDKGKASYLLGWVAYREERFDEAIAQFQTLLESDPLSPRGDESQYWIAWSYFRKKEFQKAGEEFQRLVKKYPESPYVPSALLKMGDAYYNLKRYAQASNSYFDVARAYPKSKEAPEADFGILLCLVQEKKFDTFASRVEAFLKKYPQHSLSGQALMQLGDYYQQERMKEKAIKTYRELVGLYPTSEWAEEAQFRIALLFIQERRWAEAVEEMDKVIRHYPKGHLFVEAHVELGGLHLLLKDYPKALERYEWVIKNHPQHPLAKKVYLGMEEGYLGSGKMDLAEKILKELIGSFPQDDIQFEGQLRLGTLYLLQKKFGEAVAALSVASRSPDERVAGQAQFKLGEVYLEAGNRESAVVQFSKVIYLYPHHSDIMEEALLKLGALYAEEKKISEAKQVYRKLLEKSKREDRREIAKKMLDQMERGGIR
ncbi:MAG: tetratricopeptide repeat protein, partial [Thermodesulfobacteriota bacterium]